MKSKIAGFMLALLIGILPFIGQMDDAHAHTGTQLNQDEADALAIVYNGQANAIVIVDETDDGARQSADILVEYVKKSTGVELPIVTPDERPEVGDNEQLVHIHIGKSHSGDHPYYEELEDLDRDGFLIFSEGEQMTIVGPTPRGTRNGVYEFLERYVGVIWLMPDERWEDVPEKNDIFVPKENIREEPDFPFRSMNMGGSGGLSQIRGEWQHHNRIQRPVELAVAHNLISLFPPEKYGETNPEFYPNGNPPAPGTTHGWQPCFTEEGTIDAAVEGLLEYFERNPNALSYSLSTNDGGGFCEADPAHPHYPGDELNSVGRLHLSEIFFGWVNEVVEQVTEVYPDKWFGAYAYMDTMDPSSFPLHPNVVPMITKDRLTWIDEEVRVSGQQHNDAWKAKSSQTAWYEYLYGQMYFVPRVYFHQMAENYQYAKENDIISHHADFHPTLGDGPKGWLSAKLQWDADQDVDALLEEWYERAVGAEAAPYLAAYYELWENFWTERVIGSNWFEQSKHATYLSLSDFSYLELVTEEDINESRSLLETALAKAKTEQQQTRAELMLRQFEFYEASALSYPKVIEAPSNDEEALEILSNVDRNLELAKKRLQLIEEFEEDLALRYPGDPFRRGGIWSGLNAFEFWHLVDYLKEHEPTGGRVTDQATDLAYGDAETKREFSRLLLHADLPLSLTRNPSFEEGDESASDWTFWNPNQTAHIQRVEGFAYTGDGSVLFENTSQGGIYQILPIKPGLLASEVHYYTPAGTETEGTIQIVIEAFNADGNKLIFRSDLAPLSDTAGEWASVGFFEEIPETINGKEVTEILLNAQINHAEDAQVYQDDLVVYQYVPSSADIKKYVERFEKNGEFENKNAARALNMHLTAIGYFEQQGEMDKVIEHMNGFYQLLDSQKENEMIPERVFNILKLEAESFVNQFVSVGIDVTDIHAATFGNYPISVTLGNNTAQMLNVTLESDVPEHMMLVWDSPIQIAGGQTIDIEGMVHITDALPDGEYELTIHITAEGTHVQSIPVTLHYTSNLVKNSSFEEVSQGLPLSWASSDSWTTGSVLTSSEAARTGDRGIQMTTDTSGGYFVYQQNIEIEGGNTYQLSAWLKSNIDLRGRALMKIEYYHNTEGFKSEASSSAFGSYDEWENVQMQAEAPADANRARIFIRLFGPGTVNYDDVSLRRME